MSILNIIRDFLINNNLPKGIIFKGNTNDFIKIKDLILSYYFCAEYSGCGNCKQCIMLKEGTHPDYVDLLSSDSIATIRDKISKIKFSPKYTKKYILVCDAVEKMTFQSLQSFLIPLENNDKSFFLFHCIDGVNLLPESLVSRCFLIEDDHIALIESDQYIDLCNELSKFVDGIRPYTWFDLKKIGNPSLYVVLYLLMKIVKVKFDYSLENNQKELNFWSRFYQELVKMVKNLHQNPNINPGIIVQRIWTMIQMKPINKI
jgi:hypothetical protein